MPKRTRADLLDENEVLQIQLDHIVRVLEDPDTDGDDKVELLVELLDQDEDEETEEEEAE